MQIYTIQLAKWRLAKKRGIRLLDTTVKSGRVEVAPSWEIVYGHKNREITDQQYIKVYHAMLDASLIKYPEYWDSLLEQETICLACYCRSGVFCHRHLLADRLRIFAISRGLQCEIVGELQEV